MELVEEHCLEFSIAVVICLVGLEDLVEAFEQKHPEPI